MCRPMAGLLLVTVLALGSRACVREDNVNDRNSSFGTLLDGYCASRGRQRAQAFWIVSHVWRGHCALSTLHCAARDM